MLVILFIVIRFASTSLLIGFECALLRYMSEYLAFYLSQALIRR